MILYFNVEILFIEYEFEYFVIVRDVILRNVYGTK